MLCPFIPPIQSPMPNSGDLLLLRLIELLCVSSERGEDVARVCSATLPNILASPRTLDQPYVDAEFRKGEHMGNPWRVRVLRG